jgi:hypothetical protein
MQGTPLDRRALLRRAGRLATFGAIAAGAGTLVARGQVEHLPCDRLHVCRGCGKVTACALPQAMSFRKVSEKEATS